MRTDERAPPQRQNSKKLQDNAFDVAQQNHQPREETVLVYRMRRNRPGPGSVHSMRA